MTVVLLGGVACLMMKSNAERTATGRATTLCTNGADDKSDCAKRSLHDAPFKDYALIRRV
ncbi:hypothetical protein [Lentibacter algarum]|uniref:hypothetical protein n=1 Tax=Lentibacter algarum TaxID=576131 RepID=UPI0026EDE764|nr:hypothetical protein [Lentibacter algarum]